MGEEAEVGEARPVRRHRVVVFGLIIVGVLLSLTSANAETELSRRRHAACDGTLPLPPSAFVLSFAGVAVGAWHCCCYCGGSGAAGRRSS
jgi:hypothetical protein